MQDGNNRKKAAFILQFLLLAMFSLGLAKKENRLWDWEQSPTAKDWQQFLQMPTSTKLSLWNKIEKDPKGYAKLAWEWRLGWIKACASRDEPWCSTVLQQGLFDRALVVRAETAAMFGDRFAGSGHRPALRLLSSAYAVQQNHRSKQPLFVQYRILHAIKQIGGQEGLQLGERLAKRTEDTSRYWQLLAAGPRAKGAL